MNVRISRHAVLKALKRGVSLMEALALTLIGGLVGIALADAVAAATGTLPMLGLLFEDDSGKGDIRLLISPATAAISSAILLLVGLLSGLVPSVRASHLDPSPACSPRVAKLA